jgi:hypothetical protein
MIKTKVLATPLPYIEIEKSESPDVLEPRSIYRERMIAARQFLIGSNFLNLMFKMFGSKPTIAAPAFSEHEISHEVNLQLSLIAPLFNNEKLTDAEKLEGIAKQIFNLGWVTSKLKIFTLLLHKYVESPSKEFNAVFKKKAHLNRQSVATQIHEISIMPSTALILSTFFESPRYFGVPKSSVLEVLKINQIDTATQEKYIPGLFLNFQDDLLQFKIDAEFKIRTTVFTKSNHVNAQLANDLLMILRKQHHDNIIFKIDAIHLISKSKLPKNVKEILTELAKQKLHTEQVKSALMERLKHRLTAEQHTKLLDLLERLTATQTRLKV